MTLIVFGILACEIGFWLVLAGGLASRYLLRMPRLSRVLLLCVPLLDVLLLSLITWDLLANRAVADGAHGLGALYLGFTVAFGHQIIARVDAWAAHRFAGGPAPLKRARDGIARVRYEWGQWLRMLLCAVIASAVLLAMTLLVGDPSRTGELSAWIGRVWLVTGVWLIAYPLWESGRLVLRPAEGTQPPPER